jgi:hypothetical protein
MTAKEKVLDVARDWTDEQAELALQAVENGQSMTSEERVRRHRAAMERAAALRAKQTKVFDVAALVREGREELGRRNS